jgi:hypothetical protein
VARAATSGVISATLALKGFKFFGAGLNKFHIGPPFADDDVGHSQKDVDVIARFGL